MRKILLILQFLAIPLTSYTQVSSQGNITFENKIFENDDNASTIDQNNSISTDLEVSIDQGSFSAKAKVLARTDIRDSNRDVFYLSEGYLKWQGDTQSLSLGAHKFNWSSNEAFHPLDSLNSRNFDGDFENAEKLGEPSLVYNFESDNYFIEAGLITNLTIPILPAATNRLSFSSSTLSTPFWIGNKNKLNESSWTSHVYPQHFIKWSGNYFNADINVSYLDHLSRENIIIASSGTAAHAVFLPVKQIGLGVQKAFSQWIVKLEALNKDFLDSNDVDFAGLSVVQDIKDHSVIALGLENGITHAGGAESTFIFEYQKLMDVETAQGQALNAFQNDILLAWRLALNNINGSEVFFSLIYDLEKKSEYLVNLSFTSRLTDVWKYSTGVRSYNSSSNSVAANGFENLKNSDHIYFNLSRFF